MSNSTVVHERYLTPNENKKYITYYAFPAIWSLFIVSI